jgi:hypothetical protein
MKSTIQSAVIPSLLLNVGDRAYTVVFPLSAIVRLEDKLGRSLKTLQDWLSVPAKDIPALIEAGLSKHHPDVTAAEITAICDCLNPEALDEIQYALCSLAFPRMMARIEANRAKALSPNG